MPLPKLIRLQVGYIEPMAQMPAEIPSFIDRPVLLVYAGNFMSMDGEVEVKKDDLERLVKNHNSLLAKAQRLMTGDFPVHNCPPLQLDHSVSARDTVGRVVSELTLGRCELEPGDTRDAVYGMVRFLGRENVEKCMDGRYCHVSVGADFKEGRLQELSVTPFPAASNARLLSKFKAPMTFTHEGSKITITKGDGNDWYFEIEGQPDKRGPFQMEEDAVLEAKQAAEALKTSAHLSKGDTQMFAKLKAFLMRTMKLSEQDAEKKMAEMPEDEKTKLAEEEKKDHERLKKFLMDEKKMSAEDAEKCLSDSNMEKIKELSAEVDEHEKKLAAESDEAARAQAIRSEEHKKNMTAKRAEITKLSSDLRASIATTKMATRKAHIMTRLTRLRTDAKITPAEVKKIDIAKLAAESDATVEAVLKSYADREPVIFTGMIGSKKGEDTSKIHKQSRLSALEQETRANMPFLAGASKSRMAKLQEGEKEPEVEIHVDTAPHVDMQKEIDEAFRMMDEGKIPEAKEKLKGMFGRYGKHLAADDAGPAEVEMSALAKSVESMQNQVEQLMQLSDSLAGAEN